jgi:hypothetical protein
LQTISLFCARDGRGILLKTCTCKDLKDISKQPGGAQTKNKKALQLTQVTGL